MVESDFRYIRCTEFWKYQQTLAAPPIPHKPPISLPFPSSIGYKGVLIRCLPKSQTVLLIL